MENDDILIELADIVSNGDERVVRDVTLLVRQPEVFVEAYQDWYESQFADSDDDNADIVDVFTSWLVELRIGASIDVNAAPKDIIEKLTQMQDTLGYSLGIENLSFTGDERTTDFLDLVGTHLESTGFGLYRMDVEPDNYLLFIVRDEAEDDFMRDVASLGLDGHMH